MSLVTQTCLLTDLVNQRELVHCTDDVAVHGGDNTLAVKHSEKSS